MRLIKRSLLIILIVLDVIMIIGAIVIYKRTQEIIYLIICLIICTGTGVSMLPLFKKKNEIEN